MTKRKKSPPHPALNAIRAQLRATIAQQGYSSVEKFAHENELEQSVLSRFFSGRNDILLSTYLRIASALDLSGDPYEEACAAVSHNETRRININDDAQTFQFFASEKASEPLLTIHTSREQKKSHIQVDMPVRTT